MNEYKTLKESKLIKKLGLALLYTFGNKLNFPILLQLNPSEVLTAYL